MTSRTAVRTYLSPSMVLLALDWPDSADHTDFLGFAIKRTPGFLHQTTSWLPNRINFKRSTVAAVDHDSNVAPIQKFMWWDARFGSDHTTATEFDYEVSAVLGTPAAPLIDPSSTTIVHVKIPNHVVNGIGTWFNRAVVSSQAFSALLAKLAITNNETPTVEQNLTLRSWLSNGMEQGLIDCINNADELTGAIYHLTDLLWVIPALSTKGVSAPIDIVYDAVWGKDKAKNPVEPPTEKVAIPKLAGKAVFHPRDKTHIMHNKFFVAGRRLNDPAHSAPNRVVMGSANYTSGGLTSQANLIHTFESPELASHYLARYQLLKTNPALQDTASETGWSSLETVGDANVRVCFSPEPSSKSKTKPFAKRESIDTVVQAVSEAKSSVLFCLFSPTDEPLRQACFAAGDRGRMMFGLVNNISNREGLEPEDSMAADEKAAIELYHRSKNQRDVVPAAYFVWDNKPTGFLTERQLFPGENRPEYAPVIVHHKFIVIDGETDHPIIYSGSANMSKNSVNFNDENLLEISGSRGVADIYMAEFFRLYEHYRARAHWVAVHVNGHPESDLMLKGTRDEWAGKFLRPGSPESRARVAMVKPVLT